MEKKLKEYLTCLKETDVNGMTPDEVERFKQDLLIRISFFQHERLVHLIVTITFAILTMLSVIGYFMCYGTAFLFLSLLFLILLIPYIRHYYILENGVQKLYTYLP